MRRTIKKKALIILLTAAILMPSGVSWSDQTAVQAMEITENEQTKETAADQRQPREATGKQPDMENKESETQKEETSEETKGKNKGGKQQQDRRKNIGYRHTRN